MLQVGGGIEGKKGSDVQMKQKYNDMTARKTREERDVGGWASIIFGSTSFNELVPLECVLTCELLPTAAVTEEGLLARMSVPVPLEVVLAAEGERAHVARERTLRGRRHVGE
jgi:hypothetical protein